MSLITDKNKASATLQRKCLMEMNFAEVEEEEEPKEGEETPPEMSCFTEKITSRKPYSGAVYRIARRALDKSMKHRSNRKSHEISRTETYSAHTALLILIYPLTIPDLCSERALMVCGRYKGDFPNILKLRGIRADMTNSTIDIDVQQANDIPLIKILAKNQINDSYTTQAWFSQDKELETSTCKENTDRLRWKEQYFVNVGSDCGLIIAGFYYVCFSFVDGSINGYYYDPNSSPLEVGVLNFLFVRATTGMYL
ncbi:inter-alpha-trypsin inhibitor heavy chain-related protein [Tanacetum coccineum]|uniref:Inter-alpha-trypsin inhibitor heavy chain-related protein n=1 Tax=Tanacetum coccineum TaxID=301880 RepID=A0ABQ5C609_9ASTR